MAQEYPQIPPPPVADALIFENRIGFASIPFRSNRQQAVTGSRKRNLCRVSRAARYGVHPCGALVATARRLSACPTYRAICAGTPSCRASFVFIPRRSELLSRFPTDPPCRMGRVSFGPLESCSGRLPSGLRVYGYFGPWALFAAVSRLAKPC